MDKKKILVINTKYREFGGEDSNIIEELNLLKKYFTTEYLEFDNNEKLSFTDLISFITVNNKKSNRRLLTKLNEFNPDIVYINNTWFKANLGIIKLLNEKKFPLYLKIHNYRYDCSRYLLSRNHLNGSKLCFKCGFEFKNFKIFNKYYSDSYFRSLALIIYGKKYFKILKRDISNIFVLNNFHKDFIVKLGIEPEKVHVSYNPINQIKKEEINFDKTANYVVYAGRIVNEKGIFELIKAWKKSKTQLILKIIGDGPMRKNLEEEFKSSNIEFLGYLNHDKTMEIIKKCRATITATKMYEGQPRLLCEASSFGVPSVFPKTGGISEYFPEEYSLSFEQFNNKDLVNKIKLLNNDEIVNIESHNVYEHINNLIVPNELIQIFEKR